MMAASFGKTGKDSDRVGLIVSVALHIAVAGCLLFWSQLVGPTRFVAAGPGEGGEGGGGSIQVGVADASAVLGFKTPQSVSYVGKDNDTLNNEVLAPEKHEEQNPEVALTPPEKQPKTTKTNRPIAEQEERIFTGKNNQGRTQSSSAMAGRSYGSPAPQIAGGIGIGLPGAGIGNGLPGGSTYGRLIQRILSSNYDPPILDSAAPTYAIIVLRVDRSGRILSLSGGRVAPQYFKRRSQYELVNAAAERAILASNPLPAFTPDFLPGASVAEADVWFKYPK
ncbi:MAG TPA: hypothetical protein VJX67_26645 [Blastocatellia bacterium]|nr:hypothetical protein [Blastocatellia bacterium]